MFNEQLWGLGFLDQLDFPVGHATWCNAAKIETKQPTKRPVSHEIEINIYNEGWNYLYI